MKTVHEARLDQRTMTARERKATIVVFSSVHGHAQAQVISHCVNTRCKLFAAESH